MGTRDLYLYEVVDIVGQGQYEYMEHLWKDPVLVMPDMYNLQGSFYVNSAGGGRWPQVINIWDVGTRGLGRMGDERRPPNLKRRKAFYGDWWDKAAKWRTGGFDRLCGGVPGSPSTAEIKAAGITGTLFVNEILTVRPGSASSSSPRSSSSASRSWPSTDTTDRSLRGDEQPARGRDGVGHRHPVEPAVPQEPRHDQGSRRRGHRRRPHRRVGADVSASSSPAATRTS